MPTIREQALQLRLMWGGFWTSRILMTANNHQLFDHLTTARGAENLAGALKLDPRALEILLNALVALGLLRKKGERFRNSPTATRFLVSGSPWYQGDILRHADTLWHSWSQLDTVLATGHPAKSHWDHNAFIMGMHNISLFIAPELIRAIDLTGVKRALDLGGGPGTHAKEMARQGVGVTLFDLPETIAIARKVVKDAGCTGIRFKSGDILKDDPGKGYDLVLLSQFIHAFSPEETLLIFRKCYGALLSGGRIAIHEFPLDPDHTSPTQGALFSVNMLVNTPGGRCYSADEIIALLTEAGFVEHKTGLVAGNALVLAHKP